MNIQSLTNINPFVKNSGRFQNSATLFADLDLIALYHLIDEKPFWKTI